MAALAAARPQDTWRRPAKRPGDALTRSLLAGGSESERLKPQVELLVGIFLAGGLIRACPAASRTYFLPPPTTFPLEVYGKGSTF